MKSKIFTSQNALIFFGIIAISGILFSVRFWSSPVVTNAETSSLTSANCSRWSASNISSGSFYTGYGVPWDVLSPTTPLLMNTFCGASAVTLKEGSGSAKQYIWHTGYISKNGGAWTPFEFQGSGKQGNWYVGSASMNISSANISQGGVDYFLSYICSASGGAWKCGCRDGSSCSARGKWQLQETTKQSSSASTGGVSSSAVSTSAFSNFQFTKPTIFYPSKYVVSRGENLSVLGGGLVGENAVNFPGYGSVPTVVKKSGTEADFTVPTNIPYGRYDITINGSAGKSNSTFVIVKNPTVSEPSVTSVSPNILQSGEKVVIKGSDFTSTGNEVRTNIGVISGVTSADGTTLSFTLPKVNQKIPDAIEKVIKANNMSDAQFQTLQKQKLNQKKAQVMKGSLRVINDQGVSEPKDINIQIML